VPYYGASLVGSILRVKKTITGGCKRAKGSTGGESCKGEEAEVFERHRAGKCCRNKVCFPLELVFLLVDGCPSLDSIVWAS